METPTDAMEQIFLRRTEISDADFIEGLVRMHCAVDIPPTHAHAAE